LVEHGHEGLGDLRPTARIAVGVHVDPADHGAAHVLKGRRIADTRRVIVDQVLLEFLGLIVVQDDLAQLSDAGVDPVHDLLRLDLPLQHGATDLDPLHGVGMQFHLFTVTGDLYDLVDCQSGAIEYDGHWVPLDCVRRIIWLDSNMFC